jgi:hypothetical protein
MKVIFLDIDGVLNSQKFYEETEDFMWDMFCPRAVKNLNEILEKTGAKIVVSSSWRLGRSIDGLKVLFTQNGVNESKIIGVTPKLHFHQKNYSVPRGCEIKHWLENNFVRIIDNYVIIDDDADMLLCQKDHFFKTNEYDGLTDAIKDKIINFLNKEK